MSNRNLFGILGGLALGFLVGGPEWGAEEAWTMLSDFDQTPRVWSAESGPTHHVRVTDQEAHSGRRSLAITATLTNEGRSVRVTWQTDVSDLKWSLDSRIRFWLKGSRLAQKPHGGIILVEAGGQQGGGDSHWILAIPGETYSNPEWHLFTSPPVREATNPEWAPDADGKVDPARIVRLLCVAQQEAPPELNVPFTFFFDDVEASPVETLPITYREATSEEKPDHITPIWRGFKGRKREHPALVTFADVRGWRVAQFGGAEATLVRSEEEPCYEDLRSQAKVTYWSRDGTGHVELVPPQPIPIDGKFNAACAWVYGNNWAWVPDPNTPPVNVWLRLADAAGQVHRIDLGVVNFKFYGWLSKRLRDDPAGDPGHIFWGGPADGPIHFPARLEAIEIHGGSNREPRTIYLESVAVYQDDLALPTFRPELLKDLPFPTTPDTLLPTVATPTQVTVARGAVRSVRLRAGIPPNSPPPGLAPGVSGSRDGGTTNVTPHPSPVTSFVFTAQGDETVVWRYTPATGTLSDLTVEVAGRPAFTPCAGGGPAFWLEGAEREPTDPALKRELLSARLVGEAVETKWRFTAGQESVEFGLTLRAKGKSLLADWSCAEPQATALRLGRAEGVRAPKLIRVPYLTIYQDGPAVLLANDTFCLTLLDWYHTESSAFYARCGLEGDTAAVMNGGSVYHPLTDGTRNPLGERQFINVSSRFEEVLPNIPNPPSTQAEVTRTHLYCHLGGVSPNRFDDWLKMWQEYHRKGIEKVMVTHHEDAWTNGADVGQGGQEYTMCIEAAPEVGDEKLIAYCRALRDMGYYVGLYENFTDDNPLGQSWDERNAARNSAGEMMRVWPPTYALRPLKALEMALDYPRRVRDKFGTNTAYRDCHTAYPPWGQVDFQAGTPGAGKFATNFKAWGALLRDGHRAYDGPIFSEGGHHWFSAGLVDGNYAQIWMPDAVNYPLLLDFDLLKIHPLEADISMTPHWAWGPGGFWQGLAMTIAYGHIGFQPAGNLAEAARYYYLIQQLQSRYGMIPAVEIRYHRDGRFYDITEALKTDAHRTNQVYVRYASGLEVAVNCNPTARWTVELGGRTYDLSSYGWAAVAGNDFVEYCTETPPAPPSQGGETKGRRIGYVDSPIYRFADGGGKLHDFGPLATDGAVVLRKDDPRGLKIIPLAQVTTVTLDLPQEATIEAFNAADEPLGPVEVKREGNRVTFAPPPEAEYFLVVRR